MSKKWIISDNPPKDFLDSHPELPPTISRLLWNRNLKTQEQIDEFLNPDYVKGLHDPFLFKDMEKACKIIFKAIEKQKHIVVHGDYDADGVTASTILTSTFKKLGAKNVDVFLPHRETDGYGLNSNTIKALKEKGTDLIVTCDCGASNYEETKLAKKLGMQIIITDHHTVPEKVPKADAIIHPKVKGEKYPDLGLAGGAVAFKLTQGLLKKHKEKNDTLPDGTPHEGFEKWMLDLAAIATIGDMVPLIGESRTIAKYGLMVLNKTQNLGLQQLLITSGVADENGNPKRGKYDAVTVGFQIVPRINAAGRMNHANAAYKLLQAETVEEAKKLSEDLNNSNKERQKITASLVKLAKEQVEETKQEDNSMLFVLGDKWPTGILGLVSGRLKDSFYKPALVMSNTGEQIVGSGRSISEFNIIENLQKNEKLFIKFGGHPQACGFSMKPEKLEEFKEKLLKTADKDLKGVELIPQINIDTEIQLEDVNWKLFDLLEKFRPFGMNNEEPKYVAYGLTVTNMNAVGKGEKHLKIIVKHNSHVMRKTIAFGFGDIDKHPEDFKNTLKPGTKVDMVFSISINEWNGNRELELKVVDIKLVK